MGIERSGSLVALSCLLALCACSSEERAQAPAADEASGAERSSEEATLESHMQLNFLLGLQARDAIIQGNLPLAQKRASDLAGADYSKALPEHWIEDVQDMQSAARDVAKAADLAEASRHLARLAASCGDCHARLTNRPRDAEQDHGFSAKGPEDLQTRMARHERAADGLWFGLTLPSDASWRTGARALIEAPLSAPEVDGQPIDPAADARMESVRDLGRRALEAEQQSDRVAVFGELIGSCTRCHAGT